MGFVLLPHNQKAYDNVKALFKKRNRAAVIHPTGTGKGYIARKLIEDNQNKKIIYISPSLAINDRLEEDLEAQGIDRSNVEILTYQKLTKMTKEEIKALEADYIILDEFHHCGAKEWGSVVNDLLSSHEESNVLGLSATPLRYTVNGVRDMAEELFENCIASEMSLEAAIAEGILNEPTYVTSLFAYEEIIENLEKKIDEFDATGSPKRNKRKEAAKKEFAELKAHIHEAITSLPDVLEKSMPNKSGKYIVFCSSIEDMKKKIEAAPELFKKVNSNIQIRQVSSDEADVRKNEKTLQEFADDKDPNSLKLLFCVNMLNEGYHLEDLDGGIMMRATASPTLYTQQFGRIVSAGKEGKTVLIDLVNNIDAIENIVRFYDNLSRERKNKRQNEKVKKFTMTRQLRNIGEIVRKIEGLVSRRSNNIEVNFLNKLGLSYDDAKSIIESHADELYRGKQTDYDGEDVLKEKDTLNLFYQLRTAKIKLQNMIEVGTPEYNKREREYNSIRDRIIVENIGLARWMLKNIPEIQRLEFSTEEDKEQTAMKYLIEAVDTYNPKLRTRDNTSIRFDQYLLVFLQSGMQKEVADIDYQRYSAEILSVKEEIAEEFGDDAATDDKVASVILKRTLIEMDNGNKEFFKRNPFSELLKEEIEKYINNWMTREIRREAIYPRDLRRTHPLIRAEINSMIFGRYDSKVQRELLGITNFQIRKVCTRFQSVGSYNQMNSFEIENYEFEDGQIVQATGDGFISDGVYLERQEPYPKDVGSLAAHARETAEANHSFLQADLDRVLKTLVNGEEEVIRMRYDLGLKIEDVENGEKLYKNYEKAKKALRHLRHPSRAKILRNYIEPGDEFTLTPTSKEYSNETAVNYDDDTSYDIMAGEFENVKLSVIIDDDEIYDYLSSSGLSTLDELLQLTEDQLRIDLGCTDEFIDDIKDVLTGYGLELSEEEELDISILSGEDSQREKAEVLKKLMQKKREQEEEISALEDAEKSTRGERED